MWRETDPDPVGTLRSELARIVDAQAGPADTLAIALSGGRDSMVLADAMLAVCGLRGQPVVAVHVHHGLSSNAGLWAQHCAGFCATRGLRFDLRHVSVPRRPGRSLEADARTARYAALVAAAAAHGATFVALGHHRDDQAETLLLQLLRGAGPRGLAGMPVAAMDDTGITWLRPLLSLPRAAIDAYADAERLRYVEDESNARVAHRRNALRHQIMPALAAVFPHPEVALARAATLQADAARLADDLAALDAGSDADATSLDRGRLAALPLHRAANLLRWYLRGRGLPAPSSVRLAEMLAQLRRGGQGARTRIIHAGRALGVHRGRIHVHNLPPAPFDFVWRGETELALPHGTLHFEHQAASGIDPSRLAAGAVHVRSRAGGERMCLGPGRPRRALKSLLQEAGVPVWLRDATPLLWCGDELAWVAGIGYAAGFATAAPALGIALSWHPHAKAGPAGAARV